MDLGRRVGQWQDGNGTRLGSNHVPVSDGRFGNCDVDAVARGKGGETSGSSSSGKVSLHEYAPSSDSIGVPKNPLPIPAPPTNPLVTPLLTDIYQITMAYAYWKSGKAEDHAVFDLLHRKNPFSGEFTVFAGLEECIRFIANFKFRDEEIQYLKTIMPPSTEVDFFEFLSEVDCSDVSIHAIQEGSVVFPRVPLMRVEGPLLVTQLLETTLLTLVNYASLVATNAARYRLVAGEDKVLLEFGLRRAQGPDGGLSASRYSHLGGFDGTSNVEAGKMFKIPVKGTHAHSFVSSFLSFADLPTRTLKKSDGAGICEDFAALAQQWLGKLKGVDALREYFSETNESELVAFVAYAMAFPTGFLALVDSYDVFRSGVPNFCAVALSLIDCGYKPLGIRLDSGDLAYQSIEARKFFGIIGEAFCLPTFQKMTITASNDITEDTLDALNKQGHSIDAYGIGTHLVTCFKQPALGCVYKLVEINGQPRIKISADPTKVTIPGKKWGYRIYGKEGYALLDLLMAETDCPPKIGQRILCRHPFSEAKRAYVVPQRVEPLYKTYWSGKAGTTVEPLPSLDELRSHCKSQLAALRPDHKRSLNPTPYKVSVTDNLYSYIHFLWLSEAPVGELA